MTRIALFSDVHMASNPDLRAYGQWPLKNLKQVLAEMEEFGPERMIMAGDCAYKMGLRGNYEALARFLNPIRDRGIAIDLMVGNHDDRRHLKEVLGQPASHIEGLFSVKIELPEATLLLLDTQLGMHEVPGCVGVRQRAWIEQELAAKPEKAFILVGHHHPEDPRREDIFPDIGLRDTEEWLAFLDQHSQIKAYLFGHTHSWRKERTPGGTWLINLPATGFAFREDRTCGWVRAELTQEMAKFELRSLDTDHPNHGEQVEVGLV